MKKLIRLTESDIHRLVKESVKRILKEEGIYPGYDSTTTQGMREPQGLVNDEATTVYKAVNARQAADIVNGNYNMLMGNSAGLTYGKGIYVSFTKNMPEYYRMPNMVWLKIDVPASAVRRVDSKRDGAFGIITDPNAIENIDYAE